MSERLIVLTIKERDFKCLFGCLQQFLADSQGFATQEDRDLHRKLIKIAEIYDIKLGYQGA